MTIGAMTSRMLPALGALALLVAIHGCGAGDRGDTVVSGDAAARIWSSVRR